VEHGEEQDAEGTRDIEQALGIGVRQDRGGVARVGLDHRGGRDAFEQDAAVPHGDAVVVDVDHARLRVELRHELVDVAARGQAGANVEELVDAVREHVGDDAPQEGTVGAGHQDDVGTGGARRVGRVAINREVVETAEPVIIDAGRVGPRGDLSDRVQG